MFISVGADGASLSTGLGTVPRTGRLSPDTTSWMRIFTATSAGTIQKNQVKTHLFFFPVQFFGSSPGWWQTLITYHHLELYLKPGYQFTKEGLLSPAEWHLGIWLDASCVFWTFSWHVFLGRVWEHSAVVVPVWIYGQLSILFSDFLILCCSIFLLTVRLNKVLLGLAASHLLMGPKQYTSQQFSLTSMTSRPVIVGLGYLEETVSEGNGSVFKLSVQLTTQFQQCL